MTNLNPENTGEASFCLPRATIDALLEAQATAHEICALLVLARATDVTGCYTRASVASVHDATGSFKGKIKASLERLTQIRALREVTVVRDGVETKETEDLGPILWTRDAWMARFGGPIPDHHRFPVTYILSNFGEALFDRVWFSSNLVGGYGEFQKPLKCLRDLGNVASRLLLAVHAATDMENWGGARPVGPGSAPWQPYKIEFLHSISKAIYLSKVSKTGCWRFEAIDSRIDMSDQEMAFALRGLIVHGLVYEVVTVINRQLVARRFTDRSTETRLEIDTDGQPMYELHTCTSRSKPPAGEEGLSRSISEIAQAVGVPLWNNDGQFDNTYGVLSQPGQSIGVIGVLRPRFRVRNHRNAGVSDAWNRIRQSQAAALTLVQNARIAVGLGATTGDMTGNSRNSNDVADQIPINTVQSFINVNQSSRREKRKRQHVPRFSFDDGRPTV